MLPAGNTPTNVKLSFMEQLMSTVVPAPHDLIHQGNPAQTVPMLHRRGIKSQMTAMILVSASIHAKLSTKLALCTFK